MTITLTGENGFALGQELKKLTAGFLVDNDEFGLERIDGEEAEFERIQEALTTLPFLANKKMVILRAPSANKQFAEEAEQLLGEVPETTEVIIVESKLDKRLTYYKFLKKKTDFREFPELDLVGLSRWLSDEAKRQGGELSLSDARFLVERVGINQQLLANELDKLLLYEPKITRQTIELLSEATPQGSIFELLAAAFDGNKKLALKLYKEQRAMKVEPPKIIAMLAWQLHVLAIIKTAGDKSSSAIASEAKLSPYVIQKSQPIARNLSLPELKSLVKDLLDIDVRSKSQSLDTDEALQNYLLQLSS